ncbi:MAG: hypothetical protein MNPFHGCM_01131 [Gemmatimonadaceae bacterium]|nr:hypothetical protein [Gemmatimonadaceae bacterium]
MRPRRSRRWSCVLSAALFLIGPGRASAQASTGTEGAVFLLLPVGARATSLGEAVVASRNPSEAIWWNPAAVGTATHRQVAVHHSNSFVGTGDAVSLIVPSDVLGVLGVEFNILDYGEQQNRDGAGNLLGTLLPRSFVVGATYGTLIGASAGVGLTFKLIQMRADCTGSCQLPSFSATTYAVDLGTQYDFGKHAPVTVGASIRNIGLPFQINDEAQSDPLPHRVQVGAEYRWTPPPSVADSVEVRASLDVLGGLDFGSPRPRIGGELAWRRRAFARAGYIASQPGSENGGPSIGFGYVSGRFAIDLGRVLTGFSADANMAPTSLSLRLSF